jgi:hypothetical protein
MTAAESLPPGATFPLGRIIITPAAEACIPPEIIARALKRHQAGDWGDIAGSETARDNEEALRDGRPVFSLYFKRGPDFRIVTSGDRSTTTVSSFWDHRL